MSPGVLVTSSGYTGILKCEAVARVRWLEGWCEGINELIRLSPGGCLRGSLRCKAEGILSMRAAVVGCGFFGDIQLDAWIRLANETEIVALCDSDREKAERLAPKYGVRQVYSNYTDMFDALKELDFVDIVTRPESHRELVHAAADRKLNILCQKPFATTMAEANEMVSHCARRGVRLMVNENWRWQPWYREIKKLINEGVIGNPSYFCFRHRGSDGLLDPPYPNQPYFAQMPRLLIYETLVHYIDTASFLFGDIRSVYCQKRRINPRIAGEDFAILQLSFENGVIGLIDGNRCSSADEDGPVFGDARLEADEGKIMLKGDGRIIVEKTFGSKVEHLYSIPASGYRGDSCLAAQRHFIRCLRSGEEFETAGQQYLRTLSVVFKAYESAELGTCMAAGS